MDVFCAKFVDSIGYRVSIIVSEAASAMGLVGLAFLLGLFSLPFVGILVSAIIYAIGSGLIEVLVSPIGEDCPFEHKEAVMSLLHSFYCWGCVAVIVFSTLFFALFGIDRWWVLACLWALVPIFNIFNFATCPIEHLVEEGKSMTLGKLFTLPLFWLAIILMVCAGACELSMAQWASAFAESSLGLSKTAGDLAGPCMFALLAMAGDLGGAAGPSLVGWIAQFTGNNLRKGLVFACAFPVLMILILMALKRKTDS